nr:interferon-inducible double-stranded RNA-dependent protein kinase activator A-like [Leptinotarsa decemlineata]
MLNNLGAKLGIGITYYLIDKEKQHILNSNLVVSENSKKSYVQKLNDSIYSNKNLRMKKDIENTKGPFKIKVQVGDQVFSGYAHSIQAARHHAASNALDFLIKNKDSLDLDCLKEGSEEQCKKAKQNLKSPVSLVYESAQMRKLDVEFEIIKEFGPPHKKTFVTECRVGHLTTTGEGRSKKASKKAAAEDMLEKMSELEPIPQEVQVKSMLKDKKKKNKKKKIIKNKLDEISMTVGNVIDSVVGFGKDILADKKGDDKTDKNSSDGPKSKKSKKSENLKQTYQDQLLEMSNALNFEISYADFEEGSKHFSLLSLHINPEYLCFGEGSNKMQSRNKAADKGLDLLGKMGLFDILNDQKTVPLERDTKEAVHHVLEHHISQDKDEL